MKKPSMLALSLTAVIFSMTAMTAFGQAPHAGSPYQLRVFATAPAGLSAPDSIAVLGNRVFVGYGDGHAPDGSDGKSSEIVEYRMDGSIVHTYTVLGHNDGLKIDPTSNRLWALQNEDRNANLVIINAETHQQTRPYLFGPALHGGGYDDIVFRGCKVYISASNPANNPNTGPAIVSADLDGTTVELETVLAGDANAIDIPSDAATKLNLQDPDSMTLDTLGNLVLDSQADQELIIVSNPGANQRVLRLPLTYQTPAGPVAVETDDTTFVTSSQGFILFADKGLNTVFALSKDAFVPGAAYTSADGGPFVGTLDLTTGIVTPIVSGLTNPGGMVFVDTSKHDREHQENEDVCRDRDSEAR